MEKLENEIYGIRIVPKKDETGLVFGGFEGIVIYCDNGNDDIEISKMERTKEGVYHPIFSFKIPFEKTLEHTTSGKAKAEFLFSEAKKFAKRGEEIAICSSLIPDLRLLDYSWEDMQKILSERK